MSELKEQSKSKSKVVTTVCILVILVVICSIYQLIHVNPSFRLFCDKVIGQTVAGTDLDGEETIVDVFAKNHINGYAESLKNGEIVPVSSDDERLIPYKDVVKKWVELTENRSYETIKGNEEYALYTDGMLEWCAENDDTEQTKSWYVDSQVATRSSNINVSTIIIDQIEGARVVVEYDSTLVATGDLEKMREYGWKEVGDTKHCQMEFYVARLGKEEYKINGFENQCKWRKENKLSWKIKEFLSPEIKEI